MNFDELCKMDERLLALYQEVLIKAGKLSRFQGGTLKPPPPDFCAGQFWNALPQDRGPVGIKFQANQIIDSNPALQAYRDFILDELWKALPICRHKIIEEIVIDG